LSCSGAWPSGREFQFVSASSLFPLPVCFHSCSSVSCSSLFPLPVCFHSCSSLSCYSLFPLLFQPARGVRRVLPIGHPHSCCRRQCTHARPLVFDCNGRYRASESFFQFHVLQFGAAPSTAPAATTTATTTRAPAPTSSAPSDAATSTTIAAIVLACIAVAVALLALVLLMVMIKPRAAGTSGVGDLANHDLDSRDL
jgi:hypothetical protein